MRSGFSVLGRGVREEDIDSAPGTCVPGSDLSPFGADKCDVNEASGQSESFKTPIEKLRREFGAPTLGRVPELNHPVVFAVNAKHKVAPLRAVPALRSE